MSGKKIKQKRRAAKRLYDMMHSYTPVFNPLKWIDTLLMRFFYGERVRESFKRFFKRMKRAQ